VSPKAAEQRLTGIGVSDGIAIGRAVVLARRDIELFRIPIPEGAVDNELERFASAREETLRDIGRTRSGAGRMFGDELAAIFEAHALLLADQSFISSIENRIRDERVNAEWAVHETAVELASRFAAMTNDYLRERGQDLDDVSRQLLRTLQGISHHDVSEVHGEVVLIADDLVPSEAIRLGRGNVVGFVVESGGRTSHTSIIARSLEIPSVAAVHGVTEMVTDEDPIIVDGRVGEVILHPTPQTLAEYEKLRQDLRREAGTAEATVAISDSASTVDGVRVELMANIDLPEELTSLARSGARGIGLYRSEFLYMETDPQLPTEEDHLRIYSRLIAAVAPYPATIRTYDLGGRKLAREMMESTEENPVLGLRGIRLTLARPQIFRLQLRALLRAGVSGSLWIMAPMVSRIEEVRDFRRSLEEAERELDEQGLPRVRDYKVGIMVEVPAAAMIADILAREVDFFAIGTNDLIQYTLAVDRNNRRVADLYEPMHPAILRMLRSVAASGREAGIPVSLCGEMAADVTLVPLLIGLGIRRLSAHPRMLPKLRQTIAKLDAAKLESVALACCGEPSALAVRELLERELPEIYATA